MADIFVKHYDEQRKPNGRFVNTGLVVLAVTVAVIGLCIWMDNRSAKAAEPKPAVPEKPVVQEKPAKTSVPAPAPVAPAAPVAPVKPIVP